VFICVDAITWTSFCSASRIKAGTDVPHLTALPFIAFLSLQLEEQVLVLPIISCTQFHLLWLLVVSFFLYFFILSICLCIQLSIHLFIFRNFSSALCTSDLDIGVDNIKIVLKIDTMGGCELELFISKQGALATHCGQGIELLCSVIC
jgi:hypothetical protein